MSSPRFAALSARLSSPSALRHGFLGLVLDLAIGRLHVIHGRRYLRWPMRPWGRPRRYGRRACGLVAPPDAAAISAVALDFGDDALAGRRVHPLDQRGADERRRDQRRDHQEAVRAADEQAGREADRQRADDLEGLVGPGLDHPVGVLERLAGRLAASGSGPPPRRRRRRPCRRRAGRSGLLAALDSRSVALLAGAFVVLLAVVMSVLLISQFGWRCDAGKATDGPGRGPEPSVRKEVRPVTSAHLVVVFCWVDRRPVDVPDSPSCACRTLQAAYQRGTSASQRAVVSEMPREGVAPGPPVVQEPQPLALRGRRHGRLDCGTVHPCTSLAVVWPRESRPQTSTNAHLDGWAS